MRRLTYPALALVSALALVAAGCGGSSSSSSGGNDTTTTSGGSSGGGSLQALPASSCNPVQGPKDADLLIASDLPLQGAGRTQTVQMGQAINFILKQHDYKAGKYTVAYQSCDDATAQAGKWDSGKTSANANAYAHDPDLKGVIGTFNSGAAEIMVPILNRAPNGPVAMVSPANTYVGLTHSGPGTAAGEPDKYYPTGKRNYIRLVAADDYQGAAEAEWVQKNGHKSVYLLNDKEAYGLGVSTNMRNALNVLKIKVAGFEAWDPKASSYEALANKIKATGADTVFLGGLICENGGKLIKDLRAGLGPNVQIMAPDGFTPLSATVQGAGQASEGMTISVAGLPNEQLGPTGKKFVDAFTKANGSAPTPYSVYAAQSAEVLLSAIERSDGSRGSIASELFNTDVKDGILGTFSINENGDTTSNPVTIYQVKNGKQTTNAVVTPGADLVKKA
ncbi:MAG TPA: branched-chain amino acid ABC transporter substrate-binding protein [Gaiellaceae bacterium]|nr:branched-chain amino acid ABC transporter substrate-binding protein [Gaiellaceae bacterium]